jgi:hypothetical protein
MNLIWTFNSKGGNDYVRLSSEKITIINYYIHSIQTAKKLGYNTIIYTNMSNPFIGVADKIVEVDIVEDSSVWVNLKLKVLEERNDDFCLIDPDVILKDRLPQISEGIMFDTYEIGNWNTEYKNQLIQLNELGITDCFPFWKSEQRPVINCGLLYINSKSLKDSFVKNWQIYRKWLLENTTSDSINIDSAAMIGEEYLITLLSESMGIAHYPLNKYMGEDGRYHIHHFGKQKMVNPIVPTDYIMIPNKTKKIF